MIKKADVWIEAHRRSTLQGLEVSWTLHMRFESGEVMSVRITGEEKALLVEMGVDILS